MKIKIFIMSILISLIVIPSSSYAAEAQYIEILITKGDKIINLCNLYLESPRRWREVARINRLANPDLIHPGLKLKIPVAMLKGVPWEASISFVKGDVQACSNNSGLCRILLLNDKIRRGDSIKTGDASGAEISYEDSTSLLMGSNTDIEVEKSIKNGAHYSFRDFFQRSGKTISRIKSATGSELRFRIKTPSAVAAARGTEYRVSIDEADTTRAEVLHGTIGVEAKEITVAVSDGEGTLTRKNEAPLAPIKLLLPPSVLQVEPLYRVMPLVFHFGQIAGASSYRVMLSRESDVRDIVVDNVVKPDKPVKVAGVEDGSYILQTRSIDADGLEGASSDPVGIRVRTNPLPPFTQAPLDGTEFREKSVAIKWLKVSDAAHYHLQIAEDREFKQITAEQTELQQPEFTAQSLAFKTYFFRISSIAKDGYKGIWSDTLSFTLVPPPPVPPMEQPQITEKEMHFRWRFLGDGISYHFQMARDPEFKSAILDKTIAKSEITIQKPTEPGIYYVRTSGIDATGYEGVFSSPQSFEIKQKNPYATWGVGAAGVISLILLLTL